MPPVNLLIKPSSGNCNMRCRYCFYHDIQENRDVFSFGFMSEETLEEILAVCSGKLTKAEIYKIGYSEVVISRSCEYC